MKKYGFAAFAMAALMMTHNGNAQQGFTVHINATPQFSFLQNADDNDNSRLAKKATLNAAFGVGGDYSFTSHTGIGLDVLYSLQGQRYEANGVASTQKLNYIKVPVYFTYATNAAKPVSFIAKAGPQLSLLTAAKVTDKDGNKVIGDNKELYENATFGGAVGAGVQFRLNKNLFLTTGARLDYDFTNAKMKAVHPYPSGRATTNNMTTGLEIGLKYQLR